MIFSNFLGFSLCTFLQIVQNAQMGARSAAMGAWRRLEDIDVPVQLDTSCMGNTIVEVISWMHNKNYRVCLSNYHSGSYMPATSCVFKGVPRIWQGGKNYFFQIWKFACREATCCTCRSHALC